MIIVETSRIILREFKTSDFSDMKGLLTNPQAMAYIMDLFASTDEDVQSNLDYAIDQSTLDVQDRNAYFFAVVDRYNQTFYGSCGFEVKERSSVGSLIEMGYFYVPEIWGRGIGTEAARALMLYISQNLQVVKIEAGCAINNVGSRRILEKLGFCVEGQLRNHQLIQGEWQNRLLYGLCVK